MMRTKAWNALVTLSAKRQGTHKRDNLDTKEKCIIG